LLKLVDVYSKKVLDHFENPRNIGILKGASVVGRADNPACGDAMHLYARIIEDRIVEVSCQTFGCAPAVAAGSILTELLAGHSFDELIHIDATTIESALGGLPPIKKHAAILAADAFRQLLNEYSTDLS
jgi:nitrogen fixation NifU-like protein